MILDNIKTIRENIKTACEKAGRNPDEVTLIAVSKTKPYTAIQEALPSGIIDYGENKVQELSEHIHTNIINVFLSYVNR